MAPEGTPSGSKASLGTIPVVTATMLQAVNKRKYAKFEVIISLLMCTDRVLFGRVAVGPVVAVAQLLHCLTLA